MDNERRSKEGRTIKWGIRKEKKGERVDKKREQT